MAQHQKTPCNCQCTEQQETAPLAENVSRRAALGGASVAAAALGLSACSSSQDSADAQLTDDKGPSEPTDFAAVTDVPVGGAYKATANRVTVMLTQPTEGVFKAFSSACTHQGCQLNVQNKVMACPCHASQFNIEDGAVQGGPAPEPLPEYQVEVKDGRIIVSAA